MKSLQIKKNISSIISAAVLSIIIFSFISCDKNEGSLTPIVTGCDTANVSYSATVKTILARSCYCHSSAIGGVQLDNYANTVNSAAALKGAMNPGNSMYGYLQESCDAPKIIAWINQGAKNN